MNPNENQVNPNELSPDEAKASLGIATRLSEQFFNPKQEKPKETTPMEENPEDLKKDIMQDVKSLIKEEIGGIKEMLKEALKDDSEKE